MSATLPQKLSPNNPIDEQAVLDTLAELGVTLPQEDIPDYTGFLKGVWEIWNKIDHSDDYVPAVDLERFPRENVHRPSAEENPTNGWAWRVTISDKSGKGGLLAGKTVCLKVSLLSSPLLSDTQSPLCSPTLSSIPPLIRLCLLIRMCLLISENEEADDRTTWPSRTCPLCSGATLSITGYLIPTRR